MSRRDSGPGEPAPPADRLRELLVADAEPLPLRIVGGSMAPFLRPGDLVRLLPLDPGGPRIGELVALAADAGHVVVHRVVARQGERVVTRGDASPAADGAVALLARVVAAERAGRPLRLGLRRGRRLLAWLSRRGLLQPLLAPLRAIRRR